MRHFLLTSGASLLALGTLSGCRTAATDDYAVLMRFDPNVTTLSSEVARNSARNTTDTINLQTGQYCQGFQESFGAQVVTARLELTLRPKAQYLLAGRYTYNNLVRSYNEIGTTLVRGHALILVNQAGQERVWAITSATDDRINIYGNLPMTRDACATPPLTGKAYQTAARAAAAEAAAPAPWTIRQTP